MSDSIFTKIIKGEIPCHKVYEDDKVIAFLDIHPIKPGHTLVVPKKQVEQFTELSPEDYSYLMAVAQLVAKKIQEVTGSLRIFLRIEGTDVAHTHVHLIPCNSDADIENPGRLDKEPDHTALAKMAQKLAF